MARSGLTQLGSLLRGFASLRWASLPIRDRRWAAPFAAISLGFGLFIGVAIGPGAAGTFGTPSPSIIMLPGSGEAPATANEAAAPTLSSPEGNVTPASSTPAPTPQPSAPILPPAPAPIAVTPTTPVTPAEPTTPAEPVEPTEPTEPAEPKPTAFTGTVVHVNPRTGSYVLADSGGNLTAIHTTKLPQAGDVVGVKAHDLANGTYAEEDRRVTTGSQDEVEFSGIVTYSDAATGVYTVSRRGASILVHVPADQLTASPPPDVGSLVNIKGAVAVNPLANAAAATSQAQEPVDPLESVPFLPDPTTPVEAPPAEEAPIAEQPLAPPPLPEGCGTRPKPPKPPESTITQVEIEVEQQLHYLDFAGIVQGVCPDTNELYVSADDVGESAVDVKLTLPEDVDIDLGEIEPGDLVELTAMLSDEDGSLELQGVASDRRIKEADDASLAQGDLA